MTTTMNQEQIEQLVQDWKREWCRIPHDQPLEALEIYIAKKAMELFKGRRLVQDAAPTEAVQAGPGDHDWITPGGNPPPEKPAEAVPVAYPSDDEIKDMLAKNMAQTQHDPFTFMVRAGIDWYRNMHPAPPDAVPVSDVVSVPRDVVEKFTGLLQDHNNRGDDDRPVFGINNVTITLGDLRALQSALQQSSTAPPKGGE